MKHLVINRLQYNISTHNKNKYGADISFKKGINIVYGPNSVGKTSIVTGIIYGLGVEKGLGIFKSIQNPFKPEFYKSINSESISKSYLLLEISNGDDVVTIFRYIYGGDVSIAAVKNCRINRFQKTKEVDRLIIEGEGVFSNDGFQRFLYDFLGIQTIKVPTYDKGFSKIYFENILPLFFIEQRAGWTQVQARQVTRYGIKDVKKVAFEYLMGLDKINGHLVELKKKEKEAELKDKMDSLMNKEENIFVIVNGESSDDILLVNTKEIGRSSINDYLNYLEKKYTSQSEFINQFSSANEKFESSNIKIRDRLKSLDYRGRKLNDRLISINNEINGYKNYLERIQKNKYKNRQLKKIHELKLEFNINSCPSCESPLKETKHDECSLCGNKLEKSIATPDQNLAFLEDEEKSFKRVITNKELERKKQQAQLVILQEQVKELEKQFDHQTDTYAGEKFSRLRDKILEADKVFNEKEKIKRIIDRWNALIPLRKEIKSLEKQVDSLRKQLKDKKQSKKDSFILNQVITNFKNNVTELGLFKSNQQLIKQIKIDENDSYSPYLDQFDIYNISSSSDNIRIALSYYLSLLQTSISSKEAHGIRHPNLLILDEPKQQNLDNTSLTSCIKLIRKIPKNSAQVILTTYSDSESDKESLKEDIIYEMVDSNDYLLKRIV